MRLIDKSRGVGFRISVLSALLVLAAMVLLGALVFSFVDDALKGRVRSRVEEELATLLASPGASERNMLVAEIQRRTGDGRVRRYAYRLTGGDGRHVAGDNWLSSAVIGWSSQQVPDVVGASISVGQILVLTVPATDDLLVSIGRDVHWIADVESELLRLLLWALAGGLVLAAVISYVISRLVSRRIELVSGAAQAIVDGNLAHRIPLSGARDNFDHLAQTFNSMLDRIQELLGNLEQVTNDIAHDLRTPLGRLRQGLEVARIEAVTPDAYKAAMDRAIIEADGLLATFAALLRIAQVNAGARRSAFRRVDLSEVVRSVAEAYTPSAEDGGRHLSSALDENIEVHGDRDLLMQMFANLVENALTHTPEGALITISLQRTVEGAVASVADDGPGVPADERERIFHRFYRREASRTTPGTGLGLSLVAAVAKLHGARIEVSDNRPGLRIVVTFRRQREV